MSIIFEALKKVEMRKNCYQPGKKKIKRLFLLIGGVTFGGLFFLSLIFFKKSFPSLKLAKRKSTFIKNTYSPWKDKASERKDKEEFILKGIVYSQKKPLAVINSQTLSVGGEIKGAKVLKISPDFVVLSYQGKKKILKLE